MAAAEKTRAQMHEELTKRAVESIADPKLREAVYAELAPLRMTDALLQRVLALVEAAALIPHPEECVDTKTGGCPWHELAHALELMRDELRNHGIG